MSDPIRILYIDDDAGLGRLMQKALAPRGFDIVHVASGAEGLQQLADSSFSLVALDHNLGSESGLDILGSIRALDAPPPVIYVTGSDDARVAVAALKAGAVDYVWKDVQGHYRDLLSQSIATALAQDAMRQEKEAAEREVREARDRAELLLAEVNHRIGNSLTLVSSMARLQANATEDEACKVMLGEMQARILAIANVHRRLYTSTDVRVVDMDSYLKGLLEEIDSAINASDQQHAIKLDADTGAHLGTDKAVAAGVIVTELVTNAHKYAYPGEGGGEIRVALRREDQGLRLTVEDDGIGWRGEGVIKGTGLGSRIVKSMAAQMKLGVHYDQVHAGTRVVVDFPS